MGSKGFSLVEVMVSMGVVAGTFYMLSNFDGLQVSKDYDLRRACEAHANSVIAAVQEETYYRTIYPYHYPGMVGGTFAPREMTLGPSGFTSTKAIPAANLGFYLDGSTTDRITSPIAGGVVPPQLNNHLLIQGSLRTLAALYNNGVRCPFTTYAPLTGLPLPGPLSDPALGTNVQVSLQPTNSRTNASLCASNKVYPSPRGLDGTTGGAAGDPNISALANGSGNYTGFEDNSGFVVAGNNSAGRMNPAATANRIADRRPLTGETDVAIQMTVRVNYTWKGQGTSCSATQKFEYPVDNSPPLAPDMARVWDNGSTIPTPGSRVLRSWCATTAGGITTPAATTSGASAVLYVGYQTTLPEPGTQLFCRDLSWRRRPQTTARCRSGNGSSSVLFNQQPYADDTPADENDLMNHTGSVSGGYRYNNYAYRFLTDETNLYGARDNQWVPCDKLKQCGVNPSDVSLLPGYQFAYRIEYSSPVLPAGCVMNFEVVGVDTAGNRSGTRNNAASKTFLSTLSVGSSDPLPHAQSPHYPTNHEFDAQRDEIYYPTCGTYYAAAPNVGGNTTPDGWRTALGYYCPGGGGYYRCTGSCY